MPRVDRSVSYDQPRKSDGGKRRSRRPKQAILTRADAVRLFGKANVDPLLDEPPENNCFIFKIGRQRRSTMINYGMVFNDTLDFDLATPTDADLDHFFSSELFRQLQSDPRCQRALKNLAALRLQPGDAVSICTGDFTGMTGTIHGLEAYDVALVALNGVLSAGLVPLPMVDLRALYKVGDRVK
ncbi:hypothetical protein H0H92_013332, partial [Tricholoma furcatifolium]